MTVMDAASTLLVVAATVSASSSSIGNNSNDAIDAYYESILTDWCAMVSRSVSAAPAPFRLDVTTLVGKQLCQRITQALVQCNSMTTRKVRRNTADVVRTTATTMNNNNNNNNNNIDDSSEEEEEIPFDFQPTKLTDLLMKKILVLEKEAQQQQPSSLLLMVAQVLVAVDGHLFTKAIASSVWDLVAIRGPTSTPTIPHTATAVVLTSTVLSTELLQLWIALIAREAAAPVSVHEQLSQSLLTLFQRQPPREVGVVVEDEDTRRQHLFTTMMEYLVRDHWRQYRNTATTTTTSSIASVRCASFMIQCVSHLAPKYSYVMEVLETNDGGLTLLHQMLNDFDDPLVQLSVLDICIEEFDKDDTKENKEEDNRPNHNGTNTVAIMQWLSSPEMMAPVLQFLADPLLSDPALRYLGMLATLKPAESTIVFDHIRNLGCIPTRDTERLPIIRALSRAAVSGSFDTILADPIVRRCWWDMTRVSQSKLQAAILISISSVISEIGNSNNNNTNKALQLYRCIAPDNGIDTTMSTTGWLLSSNKFVKSSIVELRIASYAVLASLFWSVPQVCTREFGTDYESTQLLLDLLINDTHPYARETTIDAQNAKYDLLESFMCNVGIRNSIVGTRTSTSADNAVSSSSVLITDKKVIHQLQSKLKLGPHGRIAINYSDDIAIE